MANKEFFSDFCWHSSIGIDDVVWNNKKFVTRMANTVKARSMFVAGGKNLLVHKATQALWKISDNGKFLEPVFDTDVLTTDDISE